MKGGGDEAEGEMKGGRWTGRYMGDGRGGIRDVGREGLDVNYITHMYAEHDT